VKIFKLLSFLLLSHLLGSWSIHADGAKGSVCGTVLKPDGKPAKKAVVFTSQIPTGVNPENVFGVWVESDKKGSFCLHSLPQGSYKITATYDRRFANYSSTVDAEISSDKTTEIILKLAKYKMWGCSEPMVSIDEPIMTTIFSEDDLQNIPIGSSLGR